MSRNTRPARSITAGHRARWTAGGVAAAVAVALGLWALWPESPPRQRDYLDATACLLTDDRGVITEPAASIWATMQAVSADTLVRVQNLRVTGPQTAENAEIHLTSLTAARCGTVLAVGTAPIAAVQRKAASFPDTPFLTVGGGTPAANVQVLDAADTAELRSAVQQKLEGLQESVS